MLNYNKKRKGTALAYGLVVIAISSIILVSMMRYVTTQMSFGFNRIEKERAFQVAEAGVYFYRWYLAHQVSGRTVQQIRDFWDHGNPYGVNAPYEAEFSDPEGGIIGKYHIEVEAPDSTSTIVMVKSTGWTYKEPDIKRTVQVRFRRLSWSEYVVLADDVMRFGSGTQVNGKIHSNYGVHFDGVANNVVSSSVYSYEDPDYPGSLQFGVYTRVPTADSVNPVYPAQPPARTDVFGGGRQFPVPTIDFNGLIVDFNYLKTIANNSSEGIYFDDTGDGRRIILKNNGTFDMCTINSHNNGTKMISNYKKLSGNGNCTTCSGDCLANYPIPDNGVIFVEDNVWIEGKINDSRVTIIAANLIGGPQADIYFGLNNLLYTNFDGRDVIGLVGQLNVKAVRDSLGDLTIDAAMIAAAGQIGRDWQDHQYDKNSITINGSLATKLRYGFAYTDGTGYTSRTFNYDNNLLYNPPPFFPTGSEYYVDLWDEM
ncbi:hypothetical protein EPO05_00920 [Patescibacteria group bacterium]|nr:MAG: hypothetical protein EPO05_00920 [Patescibacteria group bacterium]